MKIYSFSGKGKRETNEDIYVNIEFEKHSSLHIIADGMGGYSFGEIAAHTAVNSIVNYLLERYQSPDIEKNIRESLAIANDEIKTKQKELHSKLGATIAGIYINQGITYAFWLGDVQIYHFRNQELIFISENHSLINEMKKNGSVSSRDIERYGNVVTKSLSGTVVAEAVEVVALELKQNDIIFICSDGLYNSINPKSLVLLSDNELDEKMKLVENSIDDNYTLIRLVV
ncbi:PP2C family protein-serine/threonine phosphatase [Dysgonomonas termitidis]|uniref:PP2C family protein-serine/threonine phosphatase n=1 Tax=Dysgonomonas termitidis TaxID=1516126 RepID=A0ABV9L3Q7_9BACT|nr:serine/threonine protein phosphatase [Bacteroidia bacterium]